MGRLAAVHVSHEHWPILLDNFTGSGAITSHTPDIYPAGSSWAIISGSWSNLSGGALPFNTSYPGKVLINCGLADYELRFRCKYYSTWGNPIGMMVRSDATGASDYYAIGAYGNPTCVMTWNLPSLLIDSTQTNAQKRALSLVHNTYYDWLLLIKSDFARLYDSSGMLILAAAKIAKTSNTYLGPYTGFNEGSWDLIDVRPITNRTIPFSVIGDSISWAGDWPHIVGARYNNGYCYPINHAQNAATVVSNMDGQTDLSEADNASFTIIELGTNDGLDFTAEYQENLIELYGTLGKPIYVIGVLPKTAGGGEGQRITQNSYITAAIANAQSAGVNVVYWNTDGWIDPATDTADGLHPTAAGNRKIANQVLLRLP